MEELVHVVDDKLHQVFSRRRIFLSGKGFVERGNDEANVAQESVATKVYELLQSMLIKTRSLFHSCPGKIS